MNQILGRLSSALNACIVDMDTDEGLSAEWDPGSEIYLAFQYLVEKVEDRAAAMKKNTHIS